MPSYVPEEKFSTWPIDPSSPGYSTVVQGFGDTEFAWSGRSSYYTQTARLHSAIDIFVDKGADVKSVAAGTVVCTSCGISNPVPDVTDPGIAIFHKVCGCVVYYTHLSEQKVEVGNEVDAGTIIGLSGTGYGSEHVHIEIRPYAGAASFYNPLYFFDPGLITDLSFQDYHNSYDNPEWRIVGYTSKDKNNNFPSYWSPHSTLPSIDVISQ